MNGSDLVEFEELYAEEIHEAFETEKDRNPDADYDQFLFDAYIDHCAGMNDMEYDQWKDDQILNGD